MAEPTRPLSVIDDVDGIIQPAAKRRKIRKGTFSCWECKRRKMKCSFSPGNDMACNGCRRRGSKCVSQEYAEDGNLRLDEHSQDSHSNNAGTSMPTPESLDASDKVGTQTNDHGGHAKLYKLLQVSGSSSSESSRLAGLSTVLYHYLPSREQLERIFNARPAPAVLTHELLSKPYWILDDRGRKTPDRLLEIPRAEAHPVLITRYMLQLAIYLQHLHPSVQNDVEGLKESPRTLMNRLADLANSLVTTNNALLGSIEGLECVMLESMFHVNAGNLRRSWLANRRALGIAQFMGLDRPRKQAQYKVLDREALCYPSHMWFRVLFLDRHLCLMLGLPQGSLDCSMADEAQLANDTPLGRLERLHCVIASRILERSDSVSGMQSSPSTKDLDAELPNAARSLPSKWWLPPTLGMASTDQESLFQDTGKLFTQVTHYNLLNQLHLPQMLGHSNGSDNAYSKITCVNASREVLSRFLVLRSSNLAAYSCRMVDFLAVMAAITLLLAHLDSQQSSHANDLLAHQYHSDRAMVERAQENMQEINQLNADALSAQSADLLRRLLSINVEQTETRTDSTRVVCVQTTEGEQPLSEQHPDAVVSVHIPYFGTINIAKGGVRKQAFAPRGQRPLHPSTQIFGLNGQDQVTADGLTQAFSAVSSNTATSMPQYGSLDTSAMTSQPTMPTTGFIDLAASFAPPIDQESSNIDWQSLQLPSLTAGAEDWAFQGVDMAYFDSLMNGFGAGDIG